MYVPRGLGGFVRLFTAQHLSRTVIVRKDPTLPPDLRSLCVIASAALRHHRSQPQRPTGIELDLIPDRIFGLMMQRQVSTSKFERGGGWSSLRIFADCATKWAAAGRIGTSTSYKPAKYRIIQPSGAGQGISDEALLTRLLDSASLFQVLGDMRVKENSQQDRKGWTIKLGLQSLHQTSQLLRERYQFLLGKPDQVDFENALVARGRTLSCHERVERTVILKIGR